MTRGTAGWAGLGRRCIRGEALCGLLAIAAAGCGSSATQAVSGTVTLDGQPVAQGQIEFVPIGNTMGPVAGAAIENGRFEVPAVEQGLRVGGVYRASISSMVGSGKFIAHPEAPGGKMESLKNVIPPQYNEKSDLQITVSADAVDNVHDFSLKSKSP